MDSAKKTKAQLRRLAPLSAVEIVGGFLRASHPFPVAAVVGFTLALSLISSSGRPEAGRLLLVALGMLFSQFSIGWMNDYVDRAKDAQFQSWKPIASGLVQASWLPPAIIAAMAAAVIAGLALGFIPLLVLLAGTACGFAYNLWLKHTPWSWLAYLVAFAALPLFVWHSMRVYDPTLLWLDAVAWPLAPAVHLGNALPDMETDAAAEQRTLVTQLGAMGTLLGIFTCLTLPPLLLAANALWLDYSVITLLVGMSAYALAVGLAGVAYASKERRVAFRLIALASILFALTWTGAIVGE